MDEGNGNALWLLFGLTCKAQRRKESFMSDDCEDEEGKAVPYRNPYVSDATRALAAEWFEERRDLCASLGLPWVAPTFRAESDMGEVEFEWRTTESARKHFSVALEVKEDGSQEIWYMRVDDDEAADMPDGDAQPYDTFRMLWYWLWH